MTQVTNRQTLLEKVGRKWKSDPIFSTGLVLALMVILQTVALGFDYESFGAWFTNWGKNWINILRNNAGVGIVALGMTFVIISGGIDLAVGSTMVAIGAVIMVFINQYPDGPAHRHRHHGRAGLRHRHRRGRDLRLPAGRHQRRADRPQPSCRPSSPRWA